VTRFVARRLMLAVPTLLGVSIVVFLLTLLTPGDPARAIAGPYASSATVQAIRTQYHLNDPVPVQYVHWLLNAVHGNFGFSPDLDQAVGPLVLSRMLNTFVLVGAALTLAVVFGISLGVFAGRRPDSLVARALMTANVMTANVPPYLSGLILVLVFSVTLGVLPSGGMYDLRNPGGIGDLANHLVLPAIAVSLQPMMVIARMTRASMLETAQREYVLVARAVGVTPARVTYRYVLWNALPPVVSVSGLQVGSLLSGALFAEVIFSWPGLGGMLYRALSAHDVLTIQAVTLCIALTFVIVNLLADVLVGLISPEGRSRA
jgi:peptide/nickel transport system permease protein